MFNFFILKFFVRFGGWIKSLSNLRKRVGEKCGARELFSVWREFKRWLRAASASDQKAASPPWEKRPTGLHMQPNYVWSKNSGSWIRISRIGTYRKWKTSRNFEFKYSILKNWKLQSKNTFLNNLKKVLKLWCLLDWSRRKNSRSKLVLDFQSFWNKFYLQKKTCSVVFELKCLNKWISPLLNLNSRLSPFFR